MTPTEPTPIFGGYIDDPSQQVERISAAEFREIAEDHPELPDPEEPTTDSDWGDLIQISPSPANGLTTPIAETGL